MNAVHNESGDCSCTSCINKSGSSGTSLKRVIRIGSRANKLHYGNKLPSKDKKLLDRLVATRKEYDKLRSELLTSSSGDRGGEDGKEGAVLDLVKLVDKGEASEHNALGECCSCCICESLRAKAAHKRHRHPRAARADHSSRTSAASRHKDTRRRGKHYDAKQVHSDPCTCTLKLSGAIKRRSREMINKMRHHEKSEDIGEKVKKPNKYMQKIKHSESRLRQALKNEARRSIKSMRETKSRFQQSNPDISSEVIRVARDKIIRQSQADRKARAKNKNLSETLDSDGITYTRQMKREIRKSAKKIAGLVNDSKTKLKESVEMLAQKSVEKIKDFESKRKLSHHMCDCPEVAAGLTKMAKQNINRQQLASEDKIALDNEVEKALDESLVRKVKVGVRKSAERIGKSKTKMNRKLRAEITKSGQRIADLVHESKTTLRQNINAVAQKSARKIRQLDAKRKAIRSICECPLFHNKISNARKSLNRQKKESLEKMSQLKNVINTEVKKSSEKLADHIKVGVKRSAEKLNRAKQQIVEGKRRFSQQIHPPQKSHETTMESKKGFRIKKSSKASIALVKKKEMKDWECDPPCFPEECIPQECYKKNILRNDTLKRKGKIIEMDEQKVMEKSLSNLSSQLDAVQKQVTDQRIRKAKNRRNKAIKMVSATSGKGTSLDKKRSSGKAVATAKPTITLKVGAKNKTSSNSSCQCEKTSAKSIYSIASDQGRESKPVIHVASTSTQEGLKKMKQSSVLAKKREKRAKKTGKTRSIQSTVTSRSGSSSSSDKKRQTIMRKRENAEEVDRDINEVTGARKAVRISSSFSFEIEFSKDTSSGKLKVEKKANNMRLRNERSQTDLETRRLLHQKVKQTQKSGRFKPSSVSTSKATKTRKPKYDIVHYRSSSTSTGQTKSASSFTSRSRRAPNKGAQVRLKKKEKTGSRSVVRIGSTFNFNIEFYKENQSDQKVVRVRETPVKTQPTPKKSSSVKSEKTYPKINKYSNFSGKRLKTRNQNVGNRSSRTHRSSFSEKSNMTLIKNNLKKCLCVLKLSKQRHNKQKKVKKSTFSIGTSVNDQSHMRLLKSSGTLTKERKNKTQYMKLLPYECEPGYCVAGECDPYDCQLQIQKRGLKYRSKGSGTFNRRTRSTSSFTSRSIMLPKNKKVQSVGLIRKHKKQAVKSNVPKVVTSYPDSARRQAVRIGSNFSFSVEFSKDNALESPGRGSKYSNYTVESKKRSFVKRKGSQGDSNLLQFQKSNQYKKRKMGNKGTRMQETSEGRSSQVTSSRKMNRGTAVKPILKRCFCTLNLPTRGKRRNFVPGQQNYTVGRMTIENRKVNHSVWTPFPSKRSIKSQPSQTTYIFSQSNASSSHSKINTNITGFPIKEIMSICLLPKANTVSSIVSCKSLLNFPSDKTLFPYRHKNIHKVIKNKYSTRSQILKRCFCTFDLQVPLIGNNKYRLKTSEFNSLGVFPCKIPPENSSSKHQINCKSFRSKSKPKISQRAHNPSSVCSVIMPPNKHQSEAKMHLKNSKLGVSPFEGMHTVYRQTLLPYECEPNICVPGECDPYECLKLIKKRTRDGRTQSSAAVRKTASTESNIAHINEGLQINREPVRKHQRNYAGHSSSKDTTILSDVSPSRQAVRIGSNFSFNVEFSKDKTVSSVPERREEVKYTPVPRDNRTTGVTTRRKRRDSGSQSLKQRQHRYSQIRHVVDEKSTMTTSLLKRCFCTAKLLGYKVKPHPVQKVTSEVGTTTKKYKEKIVPFKENSERGSQIVPKNHRTNSFLEKCRCIFKNMRRPKKQNVDTYSFNLDPNECEPGFCVPGACDPYVCLERIKKRKYDSAVNTEMPHKKTKAVEYRLYNTPRAQQIQTSRDNASVITETSANYHKPNRQGYRQITHREHDTELDGAGRQAVKIGSNFSFSVEFYKGTQPRDTVTTIETPVHTRTIKTSKPYRKRTRSTFTSRAGSVSTMHGTSDVNLTKTKKIQSMINTASRCFCTLSLNKNYKAEPPVFSVNIPPHRKNRFKALSQGSLRSTQTALGTFLERCKCMLRFNKEKKGNFAAEKISTSTKIHGKFLPQSKADAIIRRTTHTSTTNRYKPSFKKCDPYECRKIMKQQGTEPKVRVKKLGCQENPLFVVQMDSSNCSILNRDETMQNMIKWNKKMEGLPICDGGSKMKHDFKSKGIHPNKKEIRRHRRIHSQRTDRRVEERKPKIQTYIKSASVPNRQAVRIGSNFSFNIEFYKDRGNRETPTVPVFDHGSRKKDVGKIKYSKNVQYGPSESRSVGNGILKYHRDSYSQVDGLKTEERSVGTFLERCFCTLNLRKNPISNERKSTQINRRHENAVYFRERGTEANLKRKMLKPYECEPNVCIPGECDPYECYERIQQRLKVMCSKCCGSDPPKSCDKCIKTVELDNRSVYTRSEKQIQRTDDNQTDRIQKVAEREHNVHRQYRDNVGHRQAVRIGSDFSFKLEFFKENQSKEGKILRSESSKREKEGPVRNMKSIEMSTDNIKIDRGAGEYKRHHRNTESQVFYEKTNSGSGTERMLKRCFCTLKLQQKQSHKPPIIKTKYPNYQRVYNFETHRIGASSKMTSTKKQKKLFSDLKPYECEPGFCVPGECNPYECLERIKKRNVRTTGTRMDRHCAAACSMASSSPTRVKGINALCKGERHNFTQHQDNAKVSKPHQQSAVVEVPRFTNIFGKRDIQSVKIGSNFSFNIEFYKECMPAQAKHTIDSCDQSPKIKRVRYADGGVSTTSRGTRSKYVSQRPATCHDQAQMAGVRTESKSIGVGKVLKRCFCTLKFQNQNLPRQRVLTVGRVAIEENRNYYKYLNKIQSNYNDSPHEITTIYPYKPKKYGTFSSKPLITNNKRQKLQKSPEQSTNSVKLLKTKEIKEKVSKNKLLKKRKLLNVNSRHISAGNIKSNPGSHFINQCLNKYFSLFSRGKTTKTELDRTTKPLPKNNSDNKLKATKMPELAIQRINKIKQKKSNKSTKSDRQSKQNIQIPAKKSKSLKVDKLSGKGRDEKQRLSSRIQYNSHHQSGDGRQSCTINSGCVPKDKKLCPRKNGTNAFTRQMEYKSEKMQGKRRDPYSKKYVVGYTFAKSGDRIYQTNKLCGACKSCTMMNCNCHKRVNQSQTKKTTQLQTTKRGKKEENSGKRQKNSKDFKISVKANETLTIDKDKALNPPTAGAPEVKKDEKGICKDMKPAIENALMALMKLLGIFKEPTKKPIECEQRPLFVVTVDSSSCSILNREETLKNMIKWNKMKKELCVEEQNVVKRLFKTGVFGWKTKDQSCVCGSTVCQEEMDKIAEKLESRAVVRNVKPCVCGSTVCELQSQKEVFEGRTQKKKSKKSVKKKKPKTKLKQIKKRKPKTQQNTYQKWKKGRKRRMEDEAYMSSYTRADKRRHDYHVKRIKTLNKHTKEQRYDPNSLLIAASVCDVAHLGKFWISSAARQVYRTIRHPIQTFQSLGQRDNVYNTGEMVTEATFKRVKTRIGFTTCMQSLAASIERNKLGYMLIHLGERKRPEFRPTRPINEADRAAQCGFYLASLRQKRCLWVYDRCPSFYPHCMSMLQLWKQFSEVLLFLLAIVVWSPCIFCVEVFRACMCCTFCTQ